MTTKTIRAKIIQAGYSWSLRIEFSSISFPAEATFTSQVRRSIDSEDVLYEMTTANGGVVLVDANHLDLTIPGSASAGWPKRTAYIDVVRTDGTKQHLGFMLAVPVVLPVTRGI